MNHFRKIIGVCGTIAAGKTTLCKQLCHALADVETLYLEADVIAHDCYAPGTKLNHQLVETFGLAVRKSEDGSIDRQVLGKIVFSNSDALQQLNSLVWPAIEQRIQELCEAAKAARLIIIDAALLVTANWHHMCDEIWYVKCSLDVCIARCRRRNPALSERDIIKRYKAQMTLEQVTSVALPKRVFVISNDTDGEHPNMSELMARALQPVDL